MKRHKSIQHRLDKITAKMTAILRKHGPGRGACWICGLAKGTKIAREAYKLRCTRCEEQGRTSPDVQEYEALRAERKRLEAE